MLVLSADPVLLEDAERELSAHAFVPMLAADVHDARRYLAASRAVDVVLVDVRDPAGARFAEWAFTACERMAVVLLADEAALPGALRGFGAGARDVVELPPSWSLVTARLTRALGPGAGEESARALPAVITASPRLTSVVTQLRRAAHADVPVLLLGPRGAPRAALAELLHVESGRAHRAFHVFSCVGASTDAVERRLFGDGEEAGALVRAAGGTLLLDGIEHLAPRLQARLLRCLEERRVDRPSGERRALDVRLVVAAEEGIAEAAAEGAFRADLFYRLAGFSVHVPPLGERRGELPALAAAILDELASRSGRAPPTISSDALAALIAYAWPGDDEELVCALSRALVLCTEDTLKTAHLPRDVVERRPAETREAPSPRLLSFEEYESQAIQAALDEEGGNVTLAARRLGIGRATFYRKAKKFGVRLR